MQMPQYSGKDNVILLLIVPVGSIILNLILFGAKLWSGLGYFFASFAITCLLLVCYFILCGLIALDIKQRIPKEEDLRKRVFVITLLLLLLSALFMYALFNLYAALPYFRFQFNTRSFVWAYCSLGVANVFITLLMEGVRQYKDSGHAQGHQTESDSRFKKPGESSLFIQ
jgi:two-component system, LytTR family, sensor kinase